MNIIKKHYTIKQCQKLDKLISIQEDICKALEIGYNLCVDFECIVHLAKVYLKNDKHLQDSGYLNEKYTGDKLEVVREIRIGWDCYKREYENDVAVFDGKKILGVEEDCYVTWEDIDENFQFFWKDYEDYKIKANKIIASFENKEYDFANLHCIEDLILEYDSRFNCKCLSTRITEHLCMIRSFKFAQDVISEGHWIKNQWSKNSCILSGKEKNNLGMNDISNKNDSSTSSIKNVDSAKNIGNNNDAKNVNVKCYRDNGDGTMDWVNCPVIITDGDNDVYRMPEE